METLVASVLIVIVFMLASMILNNLFSNAVTKDTSQIEAHITELEYLYKNEKLLLPYSDDFQSWEISIKTIQDFNKEIVVFDAVKQTSQQNYSKQIEIK